MPDHHDCDLFYPLGWGSDWVYDKLGNVPVLHSGTGSWARPGSQKWTLNGFTECNFLSGISESGINLFGGGQHRVKSFFLWNVLYLSYTSFEGACRRGQPLTKRTVANRSLPSGLSDSNKLLQWVHHIVRLKGAVSRPRLDVLKSKRKMPRIIFLKGEIRESVSVFRVLCKRNLNCCVWMSKMYCSNSRSGRLQSLCDMPWWAFDVCGDLPPCELNGVIRTNSGVVAFISLVLIMLQCVCECIRPRIVCIITLFILCVRARTCTVQGWNWFSKTNTRIVAVFAPLSLSRRQYCVPSISLWFAFPNTHVSTFFSICCLFTSRSSWYSK